MAVEHLSVTNTVIQDFMDTIGDLRQMDFAPNEVTGASAGGPHQVRVRTPWVARIAQFCRSTYAHAPL